VLIENVDALGERGARGIHLGIVAVPETATQKAIDGLVQAGVKGILNFSPRYTVVPRGVKVITIDIAMDLARLPYYVPAGGAVRQGNG
jgi:redox-sensing transcriptional repressor